MPTVRVPGLLKELFGQRTTRLELWLTLGFGVAVTTLLLAVTRDEPDSGTLSGRTPTAASMTLVSVVAPG